MSVISRPIAGSVRDYHFPTIEHAMMANGMRLLVARMPRLPLVTVLGLIDAGASMDPPGAEGTASLTARTITEGTAGMDGAALTDRVEALGTSLDGFADWDCTGARFTVMPSRLDEAFSLFAEVLRAPAFPDADVARKRDERIAHLTERLAEPRGLADQRFSGFLYATRSRYARAAGGTLRTVPSLHAGSVRDFHRTRYTPQATTLIFVGDITMAEATRLATSTLGDWSATTSIAGNASMGAEVAQRAARRAVIVEKEDAPQSELRVGHVGVSRSHPDYLPIVVMNAILGGLFSSRINLNLREKNAFTYGASSGFDWRRGPGPFVVSTAVKSEITDRAVEEILREIDLMRAAPPSASELALATDYLAGVFPIRYESTDAVAGAIANAVTFGLPDDWFATYRMRVQAVTTADVHAAARAHVDPERMLVLAVGDPAVIRTPLERLAVGEVIVVPPTFDPADET